VSNACADSFEEGRARRDRIQRTPASTIVIPITGTMSHHRDDVLTRQSVHAPPSLPTSNNARSISRGSGW
jgi:hypothetical protein